MALTVRMEDRREKETEKLMMKLTFTEPHNTLGDSSGCLGVGMGEKGVKIQPWTSKWHILVEKTCITHT